MAFLRDDAPLLSEDRAQIRCAIPDLMESLRLQSTRIQALKSVVHAFERERARAEAKLQKYESVLAPIRRVPNEILLETFRLCIPLPEDDDACDPKNVRWELTKVCRTWSKLVRNTPSLWGSVVVHDSDLTPALPKLRRFLEMSQNLPLRVAVRDVVRRSQTCSLATQLFQTSSRWRVLWLEFRPATFVHYTSDMVKIYREFDKSAIEELYFAFTDFHQDYETENIQAFLKEALPKFTSLRRVDLSNLDFDISGTMGLPGTVTHVKDPSYDQALHHLKTMPNLIEVGIDFDDLDSSDLRPPVRHDALRALRMSHLTLGNLTLRGLLSKS